MIIELVRNIIYYIRHDDINFKFNVEKFSYNIYSQLPECIILVLRIYNHPWMGVAIVHGMIPGSLLQQLMVDLS